MKRSYFRFPVLFTILLIYGTLYGQVNLQKAYIITLEGDSVRGFIQVKDWGMNPSKILFKTTTSDDGTSYNPNDIIEFGMNGEKWKGGLVDVEVSSRDEQNLSDTPELFLETDLVFLQTVIDGPKSLYVYRKSVDEQYYIKTDSAFELLIYKKYKVEENKPDQWKGISIVAENKKFLGQLSIYLNDCPELGPRLSKIPYRLKSLEKLFYAYYDCVDEEYNSAKPEKNISLKFGAIAGISLSSVKFDVFEFDNIKSTGFVTYPFGITFEIRRPLSLPRWSFYNEYTYVSPYLLEHRERLENEAGYTNIYTGYKFHSAKLVSSIRYNLTDEKFKFFAGLGVSIERYKGDLLSVTDGMVLATNIHRETEVSRKWRAMRMAIDFGMKYSKITLGARFEPGNPLRYVGPASSLLLNYTF